MKQIIPKVVFFVGAGATLYSGCIDGNGDAANSATFGIDYTKCPIAIPGVIRNLTILSKDPLRLNDVTVTVMKNGIATALSVTLATASILATNLLSSVSLAVGDDITYRFTTVSVGLPNSFDMGCCIEFEGAGCIFAITPQGGSVGVNTGHYGGAFGNGVFQGFFPGIGMTESNTYSITPTLGQVTCFALKAYYTPVDAPGVWTVYVRKNNILQDGSGGTIDTAVSMADPATDAFGSFACPVVLQDHADVVIMRLGADSTYALNKVGIGIGFIPTTEGEFILCGGSNDVISTSQDWKWTRSRELGSPELVHLAPVGPTGFRASRLYIERSGVAGPPSSGDGYLHILRKSQADTLLVVPVIEPAISGVGSVDPPIDYLSGDTINLQMDPVNSPGTIRLHWAIGLSAAPPPLPAGCPIPDFAGASSAAGGCPAPDFP